MRARRAAALGQMSSHAIVHDVGELRQRFRASRTVCGCRRPAAAYLERRSMKCSMRPSRAARTSRHVHLRLLSTSASRGWRVRRVRRLAAREPAHSTELHLSRRLAAARKSSAVLCVPGGEQLALCTPTRGAAHHRVDLCRPSRGECEAGWSSEGIGAPLTRRVPVIVSAPGASVWRALGCPGPWPCRSPRM